MRTLLTALLLALTLPQVFAQDRYATVQPSADGIGKRVGGRGIVYAVESQSEMFQLLRRQMARRGAKNVKPVLGTATDPRLPSGSVDLAVKVDVLCDYAGIEKPWL